jgi:hypothetical protein
MGMLHRLHHFEAFACSVASCITRPGNRAALWLKQERCRQRPVVQASVLLPMWTGRWQLEDK